MKTIKILNILILILNFSLLRTVQSKYLDESYPKTIIEDAHLDTVSVSSKQKDYKLLFICS